jgi:hypothetical protein
MDRKLRLMRIAFRIATSCTHRAASPQPVAIVSGDTEAAIQGVQPWIDLALLAQTVGLALEPPVRYRSYMSLLIQLCEACHITLPKDTLTTRYPEVLPSIIVVAYSLTHHLRSQWMYHTMSHLCLFHATLLSASASIDMLRS